MLSLHYVEAGKAAAERIIAMAETLTEPEASTLEQTCMRLAERYNVSCFEETAAIARAIRNLHAARE